MQQCLYAKECMKIEIIIISNAYKIMDNTGYLDII